MSGRERPGADQLPAGKRARKSDPAVTTTAAAAAAAAPPAIEEPSAGPADRDRDAFSRPLPPPPATQRPAAPSTSKKYLTPAGSASSLSDLSSATGGTPAASNALLLSPATPKAMADFAESHVPQLTLVEDRFFTYDELMELDLSSLAGFTTPAQTDMIAVADKSNRFRQDTDDWTAKAGIATTGRDVDALATRALWLGNNTNRAAREAMQDNWAKEVTVIHLFLGQFCVKYADNWHAARGGDRPTCADFTLLKRLGLSDANATIYQNLSRSVMAGGISTTGLTYLKKAGGVTFNHCLHFLLMRFPRIVLGQPRNRHVLVEDRADHLYTSPGWQPLREAFERVFLQGFSFGYLSEGLLPKDGYDNIFIKWGNLPESDFVIIKAMVEKEVSLTWVAERSLEDFIKGVRAEDGDFKAVRSHWLDRLRRKVMEEVEERVEKAIKSDDRDQLSEWATAHNSSLFVEAATSEQIQTEHARFRKLVSAVSCVTIRTDAPIHLQAATFVRDLHHLHEGAYTAGRLPYQYLAPDGHVIRIASAATDCPDLVTSIHDKLDSAIYQPMLEAAAACFPLAVPDGYVRPQARHQDLTSLSAGRGQYTGTKAHQRLLDTDIVGLQRHMNYDGAEDVVQADLPRKGSSQQPAFFEQAGAAVIDLHGELEPLIQQWKEDLDRIQLPAVQQQLRDLYGMLQLHNNIWARNYCNETEDSSCGSGVSSMLDMRTLVARILSQAADDEHVTREFVNESLFLYDKLLCTAVYLKNPALWTLALEILHEKLANYPRDMSYAASLVLQETFLCMRHGLTTVITRSDGTKRGGTGWGQSEEMDAKHRRSILRSVTFVVKAQRGLCACKECRRSLYAHPTTCPGLHILSDRQLTTSSVFTRMGLRWLVIKGGCRVPSAIFYSSRGPCPWEYWPEWLSEATLAAVMRIAKLEHRICKYKRDRPSQAVMISMRSADQGGDEE